MHHKHSSRAGQKSTGKQSASQAITSHAPPVSAAARGPATRSAAAAAAVAIVIVPSGLLVPAVVGEAELSAPRVTGFRLRSFTKRARVTDDDAKMERMVNGRHIEGAQAEDTPVYTLAGLHNVHEVAHASAVARLLFELTTSVRTRPGTTSGEPTGAQFKRE